MKLQHSTILSLLSKKLFHLQKHFQLRISFTDNYARQQWNWTGRLPHYTLHITPFEIQILSYSNIFLHHTAKFLWIVLSKIKWNDNECLSTLPSRCIHMHTNTQAHTAEALLHDSQSSQQMTDDDMGQNYVVFYFLNVKAWIKWIK